MKHSLRLPVDSNRRCYRRRVCPKVWTISSIRQTVIVSQREVFDFGEFCDELFDAVLIYLPDNLAGFPHMMLSLKDNAAVCEDFKFVSRTCAVADGSRQSDLRVGWHGRRVNRIEQRRVSRCCRRGLRHRCVGG